MLPMGTIMAVCMLTAAIFSSQLLGLNKQPKGLFLRAGAGAPAF